MKKELKVIEFSKKQKLVDFVNLNAAKLEVLSITTCKDGISYQHFLWYYGK